MYYIFSIFEISSGKPFATTKNFYQFFWRFFPQKPVFREEKNKQKPVARPMLHGFPPSSPPLPPGSPSIWEEKGIVCVIDQQQQQNQRSGYKTNKLVIYSRQPDCGLKHLHAVARDRLTVLKKVYSVKIFYCT